MSALDSVVERARADPDVLAVLLFGSAARGEPHRDLDVALVLPEGSRADTWDKMFDYIAVAADVVDLQVFQRLPLYVQSRVLREGKVLFCRDEDALYALAGRVARAFEDFRPGYEAYLEDAGVA